MGAAATGMAGASGGPHARGAQAAAQVAAASGPPQETQKEASSDPRHEVQPGKKRLPGATEKDKYTEDWPRLRCFRILKPHLQASPAPGSAERGGAGG